MNNQSYTNINANMVARACKNFISLREKGREKLLMKIAEQLVIKSTKQSFFSFLTGPKMHLCLNDAIEMAKRTEKYEKAKWVGGFWESQAEDLLKLAQLSKDGNFYLSSAHIWILEYADK